jgi:hypothetical protein
MDKNEITMIEISPEEKTAGIPSHDTIYKALDALHRDGIVCLTNAVDPEHEDIVNAQMCADAEYLKSKDALWHIQGRDTGNVSLSPPLKKEFFFRDIYANPFALHIMKYALGPRPQVRFLRSNVCLKGTQRQRVHSDMDFAFPEYVPWCYTVNITLCDTNLDNGATEIWLGTHRNTTIDDHIAPNEPFIKSELLEARAKAKGPIRPSLPKGCLTIRDPRMWHSGIANMTDVPRVMLSEMFFADWYGNRLRLTLPDSLKPVIEEWEQDGLCEFQTNWVKGEVDHLRLDGLEAVTGTAGEEYQSPNNFPFEGKIMESLVSPAKA